MGFLDRVGRFLDDVLLLPDDLRADLEAAEAALQAELFPEAEDLFAGVLAERPTLTRAALGLARARTARGDREGTLAALSSARRTAPEDGDVALWCARLALEEGQLAEARGAARTAARALAERGGAELAEAAALLAEVERRDGRPDRALKELRKAVASDPSDPRWALALLDWHAEAGEAGGAAAAAVPLRGPAAEDAALARRVGQALGRAGALDAAEPFLEAARDGGEAAAQVDLARLAWLRRDLEAAEALAREAVARGAGAEALELLGLVLTQSGAFQEASEALAAAAALTRDVRLWRYAARIVPLDDPNHLEAVLTGLEAAEPGDAVGQAVRVLVAAEAGASLEGKVAEGAGDDSSSDEAEEEPRALLAQARRALGAGDALGALGALDAWDRRCAGQSWAEADRERADAIRREALRRRWHGPDGVVDLGAAIDAVARFAAAHDLPEVLRETERLRDDLDRPLLLGVLGEFNAGKSTLINAFIGAEVAPMGIVPTTATLNVLRDGAERLVRVVRSDGSTREGGYDALRRLLAEAEAEAEGPEVDRVEIVLPSATLERVWVLDAPGTNALDPAHERLAREAARRADAVLWVFDAAQAGKLTESAMHERLRAQGRLVVPVLNKRDRLTSDELSRVEAVVEEGFGVPPVPISARKALKARLAGDEAAYDATGFPALLAHLEAEVFGRARVLKRGAVAGRLAAALDDALGVEEARAAWAEERRTQLDARARSLAAAASGLRLAVDDTLRDFSRDRSAAFEAAAAEVLAFVQPRSSRFARHGVDREDRAFLAEVLERRLGEASEACTRRLRARFAGELAGVAGPEALRDAVADALRAPLAGFWGYQRGVLAGGALARFFEEVLPRAELEATSLARELGRAGADVDGELRPALADAIVALTQALRHDIEATRAAEAQAEAERAQRIAGPLRALREALGELAQEPIRDRAFDATRLDRS